MASPVADPPALVRGKRLGLAVYSAIVVIPVAIWGVQIMNQVWAPGGDHTDVACRAGVRALIRAVERARSAAGAELGGERPALKRFREALEPEWRWRVDLGQRCKGDRLGRNAIETVDLYRYAEEHALRYEARDVARLRRDIRALETKLFGGPEWTDPHAGAIWVPGTGTSSQTEVGRGAPAN